MKRRIPAYREQYYEQTIYPVKKAKVIDFLKDEKGKYEDVLNGYISSYILLDVED